MHLFTDTSIISIPLSAFPMAKLFENGCHDKLVILDNVETLCDTFPSSHKYTVLLNAIAKQFPQSSKFK